MLLETKKILLTTWYVIVGVIVYNQSYEMTQWFYIDYMKYEDVKNTIQLVSYDLVQNYDTNKPVVFIGNYTIPEKIVSKIYVKEDTREYELIDAILTKLDPNLTSCFMMPYGYSLSSEAMYSAITWGNVAFSGTDEEMHHFISLHGHEFERIVEAERVQEIQIEYNKLPGFPNKGYIVEEAEYIVVKFR